MIGGSPEELRALAKRLSAAADGMAACAAAGHPAQKWEGKAATVHLERVLDLSASIAGAGSATADAAEAVDTLADVIEERQEFLQNAWAEAKEAFEDAQEGVEDAAKKTWEYAEDFGGFAREQLAWRTRWR